MQPKPRFAYPKKALGTYLPVSTGRRNLTSVVGPKWWTLNFDGGVTGNGRSDATGRWAYILKGPNGNRVSKGSGVASGDPVTVNTCEWEGLWSGLKIITPYTPLLILGDSDLVVCQLTGVWRCNNPVMLNYRDRCLDILGEFDRPWFAKWIPHYLNSEVDSLTQEGPRAKPKRIDPKYFQSGLSGGLV